MNKTAVVFCPFVAMTMIPPLAPALLKQSLLNQNIDAVTFDFNLAFQNLFDGSAQPSISTWMSMTNSRVDSHNFALYQNFVGQCAETLLSAEIEVVAISVFSHESQRFAEDLSYHLRLQKNNIFILLGGSGTGINQSLYQRTWGELMIDAGLADCALVGEGELIIADIIKQRVTGMMRTPQINNDELADLPVPNFDDYDLDAYGPRHLLRLPVTASKGCVRSCSFCDVASIWPKYRFRRGANVANEIIEIYRRYNIQNFAFTDSLINGGLKPFREMNTILSEQLPYTVKYSGQFICRSKQDMPPKDFYLMKKGGCNRVVIGIESGSETVRMHMKKQFSDIDLHYTAGQLLDNGIQQVWNIIVGYPTESEEDWQKTLDLIRSYREHRDMVKIWPVGVFQFLQNMPLTRPDKLAELQVEMHAVNGYSEYAWISTIDPSRNLKNRVIKWMNLVQELKDTGTLYEDLRIDDRIAMMQAQLDAYENQQSRPIFPIYQKPKQVPFGFDHQSVVGI